MMPKATDWFWFVEGFKAEFGISDVRSNYSRVYSWMANQLGHLTLGLGTVFAFYWIVELVQHVSMSCFPSIQPSDRTFFGLLAADLASAVVALCLGRHDHRLILLSFVAIFGNLVFARWTFCDDSLLPTGTWPPAGYEGICAATLVLFLPLLSFAIGKLFSSKGSGGDCGCFDFWFYTVFAAFLSVWFVGVCCLEFAHEWKLTAAASISTIAIWTAKEFGSDMRNIHEELDEARKRRRQAGCEDDLKRLLDRQYLNTAIWDSRTDTMFYLAGAMIGAGLVSDISAITGSRVAWHFDLEVLGVLFFLTFFILGGRNWAYRQQAVDKTGVARANMMAVIDFCIELHSGAAGRVCEPRLMLYKFARGLRYQDQTIDHLVVFGSSSLNERLADALVTEAALRSLPPEWYLWNANRDTWRRARKISFARLCQYDPTNLLIRELPNYPVQVLRHGKEIKSPRRERMVFECYPAGSVVPTLSTCYWGDVDIDKAADLVAITRCDPTELDMALNVIGKSGYQNTVWLFENKHGIDVGQRMKILWQLCLAYGDGAKIGVATLR